LNNNNNNNNRFVGREDNIKMGLVDILLVVCERDSFDSGWEAEVRSCEPGTVP
jgi:hypothetical protein